MKYEVKSLYKNYDELKVLENISIQFEEKKVTCILGPSGCGKTTLLNIITGTLSKDKGDVEGFEDESISFIFQEDRLIPWKTVKDNMEFVLKDNIAKKERDTIINKYLKAVGIHEYKNYYPNKLSGGMRQRVGIARAFAYSSNLLIMDEPFKSLDINSKQNVMECFLKLREEEERTCILVTHDIEEAATLGDNIVILSSKPTRVRKFIENNIPVELRLHRNDEFEKLKKLITEELMK